MRFRPLCVKPAADPPTDRSGHTMGQSGAIGVHRPVSVPCPVNVLLSKLNCRSGAPWFGEEGTGDELLFEAGRAQLLTKILQLGFDLAALLLQLLVSLESQLLFVGSSGAVGGFVGGRRPVPGGLRRRPEIRDSS